MSAAKSQPKVNQELSKMDEYALAACIKFRYQVAAHAYEQLDQALRKILKGEKPERTLRTFRKNQTKALDQLQEAIDVQEFRNLSMR